MLAINNLSFSYRRKSPMVLENYNLEIEKGTICGLLGPNGTGKSTLLYLIAGLLKPTSGTINYNGFNPHDRKVDFLNDIFIVPEEFSLPPISIEDFIKANAQFYPKFSRDDFEKFLAIFEMGHDLNLDRLSMGQKKRVFLSFALACNTSLLLLDEPTNGLDIPGKRCFRKAVLESMTDDRIILISTHQVYDVDRILDHIIIASPGKVLLNADMRSISRQLSFSFSPDRNRSQLALLSLEAPGGYHIVELADSDAEETDVNLETLFELAINRPELIAQLGLAPASSLHSSQN